jgi:hypothetical protein
MSTDDSPEVEPTSTLGSGDGVGSVVPEPSCAVAVLTSLPVAPGSRLPCTVNSTEDPDSMVATVSSSEPTAEPEAVASPPAQELGACAEHVQVAEETVDGNKSLMVTPGAAEGPSLNTAMVQSTPKPATTGLVTVLLTTRRSACGANKALSVAVVVPGGVPGDGSIQPAGSLTVATLVSIPTAFALTSP